MNSVLAAGDVALLVAAGGAGGAAHRLAAVIAARGFAGVTDVVPGAATVLVVTGPGRQDLAGLARQLRELPADAGHAPAGQEPPPVEIPVSYDGQDLTEVAELTGLTRAEVIARHQAAEYLVGWLGFSPGFGYLTGLDPVLAAVPRRATPRSSVPAGSVAIAGGLAAVYPAASPGGWRLLGRTTARLWDPQRQPPALLSPGARVRFVAADEPGGDESGRPGAARRPAGSLDVRDRGAIEVIRPGPLATVQDLGRTGYGHLGVPRSGAADADSLRLANRLAGNPEGAAGLEFTFGRATLRFHAAAVVAVTGAVAEVTITSGAEAGQHASDDGPADHGTYVVPLNAAVAVPAAAILRLATPVAGLRSYVAVSGGVDVPPVLGSRSADLLSGLGPRPLRAGDRLPVGAQPPGAQPPGRTGSPRSARRAQPRHVPQAPDVTVSLRILAGPRDDWFDPAALRTLTREAYQVTPASNRTGLRLAGPALPRARWGELPSEGMVTGALQVPPDGQPILLLADHPATGGYPVIAVVRSADIPVAAQLRPGQRLRFALPAALPPASAPETISSSDRLPGSGG